MATEEQIRARYVAQMASGRYYSDLAKSPGKNSDTGQVYQKCAEICFAQAGELAWVLDPDR